ncbi:phthiocerol/phthiodiolone dimycocerosyl transferase family protein [Nocardia brasiliensis]|uniref:phthiocerol/phthiodiolone dimycocerosyl transferase family protein n=1 Tax=Nocardia brasiliensis TaxID=37326 RepID=UPI0024556A38|nr:hypothetical protein [Nocardia brasiliensis]
MRSAYCGRGSGGRKRGIAMKAQTSAGAVVRLLDPTEAKLAAMGVQVEYTTRVRGRVDPDTLAEAFDLLRLRYPILSCRIAVEEPGRVVFVADDSAPAIWWHDVGDKPLPELVDRVAALRVQRVDAATVLVTLVVHHAAADGRHGLALTAQLWTDYTALVAGRSIPPYRSEYPLSLAQLLHDRGIAPGGLAEAVPPGDVASPDIGESSSPSTRARVRLTTEQTKTLVALGRRTHTTINGLVSATLLRATADVACVDLSEVRLLYPVDLRARLSPPLGPTDATNVLSAAGFRAEPDAPNDAIALAGAVNDQFASDLATGELYRRIPRQFDLTAASTLGFSSGPAAIMSTNWGVVPPFPTPAALTITDFVPAITYGTRYPHNTLELAYPRYSCLVTTFDGRLTLDIITTNDPRGYAHRVDRLLTDLVPAVQ